MKDDIDTIPMPLPGPAPAPGQANGVTPGQGPAQEQRLDIRFIGSGSEYFRIWIVNLLLTVLTLGLYYPYARARRLRYFHAATEVGGHPLSFHGQARAMWRGYFLVVLLFLAYGAAGQYSATAGALALLVLACLWPALWHASLRFRLANTGWRGLRARFTGSRADAYRALAPLVLMALLFGVASLLAPDDPKAELPAWAQLLSVAWLAAVLLAVVLLPWAVLRLKRYQHGHYALASEQTHLQLRLRSLYAVYGVMALLFVGLGAVVSMLVVGFVSAARGQANDAGSPSDAMLLLPLLLLAVVYTLLPAYHTSRLQNLVWSGTRSTHLRFDSRLRFRSLAGLTLKNTLLVSLTLGLYIPFAAVATARLRLQAVTVFSTVSPDALVGDGLAQRESAAGDAAGDLMGVDLGL
jgi:uncharacterized membrane protein YjgN (DUF898 family)